MEKEQQTDDFCLFHEKPGCACVSPATSKAKLRHLLEREINLNNLWNLLPTDEARKAKRREENAALQIRLDELSES